MAEQAGRLHYPHFPAEQAGRLRYSQSATPPPRRSTKTPAPLATTAHLPVSSGLVEYLAWTLTLTLMLIGLIGAVVPILPSTLLILAAALIHKLMVPADLSWMAFGWIAFFFVISVLADLGCTLLGTKLFGGTKWGMAGAGGGAMVGMFFSLPGLILATIFGAAAAEKIGARRSYRDALRSGAGAAVGFVLATVARLICAAIMIGLFLIAALTPGTEPLVHATPH